MSEKQGLAEELKGRAKEMVHEYFDYIRGTARVAEFSITNTNEFDCILRGLIEGYTAGFDACEKKAQALAEALEMMIEAEVDYTSRNHLGNPDKLDRIKLATNALAKWREE